MSPRHEPRVAPEPSSPPVPAVPAGGAEPDGIDDLLPAPAELPAGVSSQADQMEPIVRQHLRDAPEPLASLPQVAARTISLLEDGDADFDRLLSAIAQDAATTAAILRTANSVLYNRSTRIDNVRQALMQVGLSTAARIAAAVASRTLFDVETVAFNQIFRARLQALFHESMTVAFTAGWLAMKTRACKADRAFAGGLFHDVGKLQVLRALGALKIRNQLPFDPSVEAVALTLERLHVEVGVWLHRQYRLPDHLTHICEHHHDVVPPEGEEAGALHVVRLVGILNALRLAPDLHGGRAEEALDIDRRLFLALGQELRQFADRVTDLFELAPGA